MSLKVLLASNDDESIELIEKLHTELETNYPNITVLLPDDAHADQAEVAACWYPGDDLLTHYPNIKLVQSIGAGVDHLGKATLNSGLPICRVDTLLEAKGQTDTTAPEDISIGEDLAAILYTSGSTGRPKGVMLSHRNLIAGARIVSEYLQITSDDRILSLLPFSFDYGLNQFTSALHQGATLVLGSFKFGNSIVKLLEDYEITGLAGVPTIWAILTIRRNGTT